MAGLACPDCRTQLNKTADGRLRCAGCKVQYPQLGNVPFCWLDAGAALLDWRNRFNLALAENEHQAALAAGSGEALPRTRYRLAHLARAHQRYHDQLTELLAPLRPGEALARETHMALGTLSAGQLAEHHSMLSYMQNVFRDWCWGDDENLQVTQLLQSHLSRAGIKPGCSILVLGCGAGRLAYDIHRGVAASETWSLDSNPLLCLIGATVSAGKSLTLTEFPPAPDTPEHAAAERVLSAPEDVAGLQFVCADALNPPFAPRQFDLVVTPWLLDVIDAGPATMLDTISSMLKPDGLWLNHGSIAFTGNPHNRLSAEELTELSEQRGFTTLQASNDWLPYQQSPASRYHRLEKTFTLLARLPESTTPKQPQRQHHLPDWITGSTKPIPLTPAFQTQIMTTRIHAFIMSLIDGKRSIADMAQELEKQRLMPAAEAAQAVRGFLKKMYEEAQTATGPAGDA